MGCLYNRPQDEVKRRVLRREAPPAEILLWEQLRDRRLSGFKFRRQFGIAHYVADFCCPSSRLIIEIDGPTHDSSDAREYDLNRTHYFESLGFSIIRFSNREIYENMDDVLDKLRGILQ